MSRGALLAGTLSMCALTVTIRASRSNGGATWFIPHFNVQGPNPGASRLSLTQIVLSWCQASAQLLSVDLLKRIALTGREELPKKLAAIAPIGPSLARIGSSARIPCKRTPASFAGTSANADTKSSMQWEIAPLNSCAPSAANRDVGRSLNIHFAKHEKLVSAMSAIELIRHCVI